jgi:CheY-like chemotaxis protein
MIIALAQYAEPGIPPGEDLRVVTSPLDPPGPAAAPGIGLTLTCSRIGGVPAGRPPTSLESLLTGSAKGTGDPLNLAYAQAVVRKHRGQLKLDSESEGEFVWQMSLPGREARPRLTGPLPVGDFIPEEEGIEERIAKTAEGAKTVGSSTRTPAVSDDWAHEEEPPRRRSRTRILLVDDEENFRDFARDVLQEHGYDVDVAVDGQEGFELFKEDPDRYTLVVLDAYMPRLGGLETSLRMQVLRPDLLVLFVSGFVRGPSLEAMLTGCPGPAEVILKPFTGEELVMAVKKLLGMAEGGG